LRCGRVIGHVSVIGQA